MLLENMLPDPRLPACRSAASCSLLAQRPVTAELWRSPNQLGPFPSQTTFSSHLETGNIDGKRFRLIIRGLLQSSRTLQQVCSWSSDRKKSIGFRKYFLSKGDLLDIVLLDFKDCGLLSWTLDQKYAERFKRLLGDGAVSAAIFVREPTDAEVVVDIAAL